METDPIKVLFVNCLNSSYGLRSLLEDKRINADISGVTQDGFEEMSRNDGFGGFEVILFHLTLGEGYHEDDINSTERHFMYVREKCPHIRLGIMSGAYDYDSLGKRFEGDFFTHIIARKINHINQVVLTLKPDFYCSYTDIDETFEPFMAEQIAKGWLRKEEIVWRNAERLNILTPRTQFGPRGGIERE